MSAGPRSLLEAALAGRYTIERELGRGGMATVYLAHDLRHDRPVALKLLHPELGTALGPERFQREIRFAARLQHPHILTVLDSGEAAGQLWFTMPYVEGESLRGRLHRERQLGLDAALQIAGEVARALDHAHQHGVIHRDIKPENILLTKDGSTLVADFGIARALAGDEQLTHTGMAVGTPAYMSPEQASGDKAIDARTDVYSLGAVLYEMLAGEAPYTGPTAQAVIAKRFSDPVPSVRRVRPNVPEAVDRAIQRALATVAADRFTSAAEFARALQHQTEPAEAFGSTSDGRSRRRLPGLAVTLIAGFLLGLGVLFAWRQSQEAPSGDGGEAKVLAVLPFENRGDSTTEYFADGITDAVRGKLSAVPGLQVIASSSSNEYKHSDKALPVIARELGADYLLIARIRWARLPDGTSRVEVSPELVDVGPGGTPRTRWQQPFDAAITDVFKVQADIAGQVASALNVALGTDQKRTLTERPTENLAAYDAFLKGEASGGLTVADPPTLRNAIIYYEQAVALDSTFVQAWSRLSRAHSAYYFNVTPSPSNARAAKGAADRAMALAPKHPESLRAVGDYYSSVRAEYAKALAAYEEGLAASPENADLLTSAALAEQGLGRWDAAMKHLERARTLDPRSATTARRLTHTLLRLHRYPEALAAADRGLGISRGNLDLIQNKAMVYLAQGDLDGARAAIRAAPADVEPTTLVSFFGRYWDLYWALDDAQQQLLLRLPLSAYDDDRGTWGIVRAQVYHLRGDLANARVYADSARIGLEETLRANPDNAQRHVVHGLALAYLGRKSEAMKAGERAVALMPISGDGYAGPYVQHQLVRIYLLLGEPDKALDRLEPLLKIPYFLSPAWLRIDPTFSSLREHRRFHELAAQR